MKAANDLQFEKMPLQEISMILDKKPNLEVSTKLKTDVLRFQEHQRIVLIDKLGPEKGLFQHLLVNNRLSVDEEEWPDSDSSSSSSDDNSALNKRSNDFISLFKKR